MTEDHPIWKAINTGGGQTCDIRGALRKLDRAGYVIVPKIATPAIRRVGWDAGWHGNIDGDHPAEEEAAAALWEAMVLASAVAE